MKAVVRGFLARVKTVCSIGGERRLYDMELKLELACVGGLAEDTRALLAAGANVNAANIEGYTPLFIASSQGHADVVQLLQTAGAKK